MRQCDLRKQEHVSQTPPGSNPGTANPSIIALGPGPYIEVRDLAGNRFIFMCLNKWLSPGTSYLKSGHVFNGLNMDLGILGKNGSWVCIPFLFFARRIVSNALYPVEDRRVSHPCMCHPFLSYPRCLFNTMACIPLCPQAMTPTTSTSPFWDQTSSPMQWTMPADRRLPSM